MATIFGKTNIWVNYSAEIAYGHKISRTVFKIQAFLCFTIFVKNLKIQNGRQFWRDKHFLAVGLTTLKRYPMGQKFRRNSSISQFLGYKHFCVLQFLQKLQKF